MGCTRATADSSLVSGDLLLFAGTGWKSRAIALATCRPYQLLAGRLISHVGIIAAYGDDVRLYESTTLADLPCEHARRVVRGPQVHTPQTRIESYSGKVWRLRLADHKHLRCWQERALERYLRNQLGKGYGLEDALVAGTTFLKFARWVHPDTALLFCSEMVMAALREAGIVDRDLNPAAYTPAKIERDLCWWGLYDAIGRGGSVRLK